MAEPNIEESNLAHIGSDADIAARKAAAALEDAWVGAGSAPGVRMWIVENGRADPGGGTAFGIAPWPLDQHGTFRRGDAYVILRTTEEEGEKRRCLKHDVYFWIGSASTLDKHIVASIKTCELSDFLGGAAVRHHRETEGLESDGFLRCLPRRTISYLDGGGSSCGFRRAEPEERVPRLFRVYRQGAFVQALEVPCGAEALNRGDAFILDAGGDVVYARYGDACSPFERAEAAEAAREMAATKGGKCRVEAVDDAGEDNEWFWGGIRAAASVADVEPECIPEKATDVNPDEFPAAKERPEHTLTTDNVPMEPAITASRSELTTADSKRRLQRLQRNEMYLNNRDQGRQFSVADPSGHGGSIGPTAAKARRRDCVKVTATKTDRDAPAGIGFKKQIRNCSEKIVVSVVANDSIFAASGLAVGDEVVSLELSTSAAMSAREVARALQGSKGYVTIVTARQSKKKTKLGMFGLRREVDLVAIEADKGCRTADAGVRFRNLHGRVLVARILEWSIFAETDLRVDDEVVAVEVGVDGRTVKEVADLVKESEGNITLFVVPRCPSSLRAGEASDGRSKRFWLHHKVSSSKK